MLGFVAALETGRGKRRGGKGEDGRSEVERDDREEIEDTLVQWSTYSQPIQSTPFFERLLLFEVSESKVFNLVDERLWHRMH